MRRQSATDQKWLQAFANPEEKACRRNANGQRYKIGLREIGNQSPDQLNKIVAVCLDAKNMLELTCGNQNAGCCDESCNHGMR